MKPMWTTVKLQSGSNQVPWICEVANLPAGSPCCQHNAFNLCSIGNTGHWQTSQWAFYQGWLNYMVLSNCRCCQVHDHCYSDAMQHEACWAILDNPYTEIYAYNCDKATKTITCNSKWSKNLSNQWTMFYYSLMLHFLSFSGKNDECEMFICECDRKAAECFAVSSYHEENKNLPSDRCKWLLDNYHTKQ